jgi:hypothetical protein
MKRGIVNREILEPRETYIGAKQKGRLNRRKRRERRQKDFRTEEFGQTTQGGTKGRNIQHSTFSKQDGRGMFGRGMKPGPESTIARHKFRRANRFIDLHPKQLLFVASRAWGEY